MPTLRPQLVVTWKGGNAAGYSDIVPLATLLRQGDQERLVHRVRGPRGWEGAATCLVSVGKKAVNLDYNPFREENTLAGMELGVMRILLSEDSPSSLPIIEWRVGTKGKWRKADVQLEYATEVRMPPYNPAAGKGRRRLREFTERPGQARFRATLMLVYGGRCCVSGCAVAAALEGAHIDPYQNPTQNSPQNGLLLRRDLHALFDANLLGVSPETRRVVVANALRNSADYSKFHGRTILRPSSEFTSAAPDTKALRRRFDLLND